MDIRDADAARDAEACAAIYATYVTESVATFENDPPSVAEMQARIAAAHAWLIAERDGVTVGYAYCSAHRDRAAYRWAADVTVYIDPGHHRTGIGQALYAVLLERVRATEIRTLCAGITIPNPGSTGLHAAFGFTPVGIYRRIGFKDGAWLDVQWWQLDLRPGDDSPPES